MTSPISLAVIRKANIRQILPKRNDNCCTAAIRVISLSKRWMRDAIAEKKTP